MDSDSDYDILKTSLAMSSEGLAQLARDSIPDVGFLCASPSEDVANEVIKIVTDIDVCKQSVSSE